MLSRPIILFSLCCSFVHAVDVYLSPATESFHSNLSPEDATLALSRHLGLDAFEPFRDAEQPAYGEESFVGQGTKNCLIVTLDEMDVPAVIPHSLHRPAFTLETPPSAHIDSLASVLSSYLHRASSTFSSIFSSFNFGEPSDVSSLAEFVRSADQPAFAAVELSKLQDIRKKFGSSSERYRRPAEELRNLLESVLANGGNNLAILTYTNALPTTLVKRSAPQESQVPFPLPDPQQPISAISTCFTSLDICNNSTSSCSGRGKCSEATKAGRTCFVCTCAATVTGEGNNVKTTYWAGESCERKDISSPFVLITGTVIVIILLFAGSVSLLYSVGDQALPSTLLATAVPVKKD